MLAIGQIGGGAVPPRRPVHHKADEKKLLSAGLCGDCNSLLQKLPNTFVCSQCRIPLHNHGLVCASTGTVALQNAVGATKPSAGNNAHVPAIFHRQAATDLSSNVRPAVPSASEKLNSAAVANANTKPHANIIKPAPQNVPRPSATEKGGFAPFIQKRQDATSPSNEEARPALPARLAQPLVNENIGRTTRSASTPNVLQPKFPDLSNQKTFLIKYSGNVISEEPNPTPSAPVNSYEPPPLHPDARKRAATSMMVASSALFRPPDNVIGPSGQHAPPPLGNAAKSKAPFASAQPDMPRPLRVRAGAVPAFASQKAAPMSTYATAKQPRPPFAHAGSAQAAAPGASSGRPQWPQNLTRPQGAAQRVPVAQHGQLRRPPHPVQGENPPKQPPRPQSSGPRPAGLQVSRPPNQSAFPTQQTTRPQMPHLYHAYTAGSNAQTSASNRPAVPTRPPMPESKSTSAIRQLRKNKWVKAGGKIALGIGVRALVGDIMDSDSGGGDFAATGTDDADFDLGTTDVGDYDDYTAQDDYSGPDPTVQDYSTDYTDNASSQNPGQQNYFQNDSQDGTTPDFLQSLSGNDTSADFGQEYPSPDSSTADIPDQGDSQYSFNMSSAAQDPMETYEVNDQSTSYENSTDPYNDIWNSSASIDETGNHGSSNEAYNTAEPVADDFYPVADISDSWDPSSGAFGATDAMFSSNYAPSGGNSDQNVDALDQSVDSPGSMNPWADTSDAFNSGFIMNDTSSDQYDDVDQSGYQQSAGFSGSFVDSNASTSGQLADPSSGIFDNAYVAPGNADSTSEFDTGDPSNVSYAESDNTSGMYNLPAEYDDSFGSAADNYDTAAGYNYGLNSPGGVDDGGIAGSSNLNSPTDYTGDDPYTGDNNTTGGMQDTFGNNYAADTSTVTDYGSISNAAIGIDQIAMQDDNAEMQQSQTDAAVDSTSPVDNSGDTLNSATSTNATTMPDIAQEGEEMDAAAAGFSPLLAASSMSPV